MFPIPSLNKSKLSSENDLALMGIPKSFHRVAAADDLLNVHSDLLARIYIAAGPSERLWNGLYLPALHAFAVYVQHLPASAHYHHFQPGGLLEHTLEVVEKALYNAQSSQLSSDTTVKSANAEKSYWFYAVFLAALLHDFGKAFTNFSICSWDPVTRKKQDFFLLKQGDLLSAGIAYYGWSYRQSKRDDGHNAYEDHKAIVPLLISRLIPGDGLAFLANCEAALLSLSSFHYTANSIMPLVVKADKESVARYRCNDFGDFENAAGLSLAQRFVTCIRLLIDERKTTLNKLPGSAWFTEDGLFAVAKTILDEAKRHMYSTGEKSIPANNTRIMDDLAYAGILKLTKDEKAIHQIKVDSEKSATGKEYEFSALWFLPERIWKTPEEYPGFFDGSVLVNKDVPAVEKGSSERPLNKERLDKPFTSESDNFKSNETKRPADIPANAKSNKKGYHGDDFSQMKSKEAAQVFLYRLREKLENKNLSLNKPDSLIHILPEGAFLLSPAIFKHFGGEHWSNIQAGLPKLQILYDGGKTVKRVFHHILLSRKVKDAFQEKRLSGFIIRKELMAKTLGTVCDDTPPNPSMRLIRDGR